MIRILKATCYNGVEYPEGMECKAPDAKTKKRWIENRIAEEIQAESKYTAMTDEQLSEYAAMKGVDISKAKTREAAIAKLEKFEELG